MIMRTIFAIALATAAPVVALAQSAAPAATGAVASKCEKPDPHPGRLASDQRRRGWEREVQQWQACMKEEIAVLQTKADVAVKEANAAVAASNAAIEGYNAAVKEFQAQADAAR
jgi:hypothetical protein